jgi:hypothetical protein
MSFHGGRRIAWCSGVGPGKLSDFMDERRKKGAFFNFRRAFSALKLPF